MYDTSVSVTLHFLGYTHTVSQSTFILYVFFFLIASDISPGSLLVSYFSHWMSG